MDIHETKKMIDAGNVTVIDIRDADSFEQGHIEGAIHISDDTIEEFLKTANKEQPLICYCFHGITSQGAVEYFQNNGFETVYSVDGGFEEWKLTYPSVPNTK